MATGNTPATAEPVLEDGVALSHGMAYEIGAIGHSGYSEFASVENGLTPELQGIVVRDRNGVVSRTVIGLMITLASAMAAAGPKSVESKSYQSGNYIVTETRTTYYSEAEKAQMRENASNAVAGLFSAPNAEFEFQVYSRDKFGRGDASGYKTNFLVGWGAKNWVFETGLGWGAIDSQVTKDAMSNTVAWRYIGMPFRLSGPVSKLRWAIDFEWNWYSHGLKEADKMGMISPTTGMRTVKVAPNPLHFSLQAALLGRVYATGGITLPNVKERDLGYMASVGMRF